jgi:hypothetical protein
MNTQTTSTPPANYDEMELRIREISLALLAIPPGPHKQFTPSSSPRVC